VLQAMASEQEDRANKAKLHCKRLIAHIGSVRLTSLTASQINGVWQIFVHEGYARGTIADHRSFLIAALDAVVDQTHGTNWARASRIVGAKKRSKRKHFERTEMQTLARWLATDQSRWALPALVVTCTGCRRGEALGLRVKDVLPNGRLAIEQQLKEVRHDDGSRTAEQRHLKTEGSARIVSVPEDIHQRLVAVARGRFGDELLFGICRPDTFSQWFNRVACREAEVRQLTLHSLRHGLGSALVQSGIDIASVSGQLGHDNVATTTRIYLHASRTPLAAAVIEGLFESAEPLATVHPIRSSMSKGKRK
jgi:integrase